MQSYRHGRQLARGLIVALVVATGLAVATGTDPRAEPASEAQRTSACPRGQALVIVDGKRSCRALGQALPAPRKGDERLTMLRQLLTSDWGNPPDRKNRRPPTIEQLLSDFGPAAAPQVRKAIGELPTRVGRLAKQASGFRFPSSVTGAFAPAACAVPKGTPSKTDSMRRDLGNGASFDLSVSVGDGKATAGFGIEGKAKDGSDRKVRWDVGFDLCDENFSFSVPECPTRDGKLDGSGKTSFTLKVSSIRNGKTEHSATVEIKHQATSKGRVAVDAKLDRVELDDTYVSTMRSTGESIFWGPSSERGTVKRKATVDMRTGRYDLGQANVVDVQVSYTGILSIFTQDALAKARVAEQLKRTSDETFARTVKHAIEEYRARENAWQKPNTCAELEFSPASRTLRLRNGQSGSLQATIKAKRGGTASDGRWRRTAQRNANVTPTRAQGARPRFSYRVTNADRTVSASFRATSPAGVAAGDWVQGGEDFPARFSGTFTGENRTALRNSYSGTISFVKDRDAGGVVSYRLERVSWTHRVSPLPGSPCQANATARVTAQANGSSTLGVLVIQKGRSAKGYGYAITASFASPRQLTIDMVCNGAPVKTPWVPGGALNTGPPGTSLGGDGSFTDGKVLKGRLESTATASTYSWNLKGSG
jgi:hypothetical protein